MLFSRIAVLGLGKVGSLAATLLHESGFKVSAFDMKAPRDPVPFSVQTADLTSQADVRKALQTGEAVLSCLPYHLNTNVARIAHELGLHYFDLTEDVPTTKAIIEMSGTAKGLMAPQCGLAPGFV